VSEAIEFTGKEDPSHEGEFSNSWYSYAWIAARMLRAELHDIAQGGIALLDQTGWYHEPNAVGMTSIYDKIEYSPMLGEMVPWDFRLWTPDVVVVALGQNDSHPKDYMAEDPMGEQAKKWVKGYVKFLEKIRKVYPEAQIVCITTLLIHDPAWDHAIAEAIHRFRMTHQDPKVSHLLFSRNGSATPGHPRISEAREMAEELVGYINRLPIPAWK
jgi:putative electron transport complex, rnfABCDGE type, D subunit